MDNKCKYFGDNEILEYGEQSSIRVYKLQKELEQKAHNTAIASRRIIVEHVFAQLKKFKILGSVYRNFKKKLHLRFNIIAGIYNLRFG